MNDNVRKVFEILDVEPNEKFRVRENGKIYWINEKLCLYNVNDGVCNEVFKSILKDPDLIIKLTKKKKKLCDLTKKEYKEWCDANKCYRCYGSNNSNCIFKNVSCNYRLGNCWINHKELYSDRFLDQEIEVEE